ncbi:aromatic amino acid lyase [uncultured Cohaesibacter sp.]|uniref:aromatic amino acid lyase n=1 Tax=uncultured Cohaesibacter sp. TaxID=1002546 RepID=UPI003748D44C
MVGEGFAYVGGERLPALQALEQAGLVPYRPQSKEGLVLVSSNATSVARSALLLARAPSAFLCVHRRDGPVLRRLFRQSPAVACGPAE